MSIPFVDIDGVCYVKLADVANLVLKSCDDNDHHGDYVSDGEGGSYWKSDGALCLERSKEAILKGLPSPLSANDSVYDYMKQTNRLYV